MHMLEKENENMLKKTSVLSAFRDVSRLTMHFLFQQAYFNTSGITFGGMPS